MMMETWRHMTRFYDVLIKFNKLFSHWRMKMLLLSVLSFFVETSNPSLLFSFQPLNLTYFTFAFIQQDSECNAFQFVLNTSSHQISVLSFLL